jgi:hypothetical protein
VWVADVGREEFQEAHRGSLASGVNQRRHGAADRDELVHEITTGKHSKPAAIDAKNR